MLTADESDEERHNNTLILVEKIVKESDHLCVANSVSIIILNKTLIEDLISDSFSLYVV